MKKALCLCLALVMCVSLCMFSAFAADDGMAAPSMDELFRQASQQIEDAAKAQVLKIGVPYTYVYSDGRVQEYYLDEGYNPYFVSTSGEKVWLALPLPHLEITNEKLASIVTRSSVPTPRWAPASYYDLGASVYSVNWDFSGENILQPPTFKLKQNDPSIVVKTSNFGFLAPRKHFVAYTWYDEITGTTRAGMLRGNDGLGMDCSTGIGARIQGFTNERYIALTIGRANEVTTCTVTIASTAIQS